MRENPAGPFSFRKILGLTMLFVAGLFFGFALCKEFWPTIQEREVPIVSYIDRRVEVPVEKIVERIVEKRVEVPVIKEVVRYVERPAEVRSAPVVSGPSRFELEDWSKLRRNMSKETVRVLLGDPLGVTGSGQELWTYPFNGKVTFGSEGKLDSWQMPGGAAR
jgi:hypothetical protein